MNASPLIKILAGGILLLVSGCGPFTAKEDPTRYYVLTAKSQGSLTSGPKIAVGVGPATIPGYLDRNEIATAGSPSNLNLAEYHVWAEPFGNAVTRVVAKNMSRLLNSPAVVPFPDTDTKVDYRTGIVLRRFEMGADHKIHLEASYLIDGTSGSNLKGFSRSREIVTSVARPEEFDSIVEAMSEALASLSKSMARDVLALSRKR